LQEGSFYGAELRRARRLDVLWYSPGLVPAAFLALLAFAVSIVSAILGFYSDSTAARWTFVYVVLVVVLSASVAWKELRNAVGPP
jgi:hypothetical protein